MNNRMKNHRILATAGHVDHGKSSLVTSLTQTTMDRLPEEKLRGITIELGFAHMEIPGQHPDEPDWSIGIIDVPGHENFVKNMVAGVGAIDMALLVTAADDGWMPQTEEHLQILQYLGVQRGLIALTKSDLVSQDDLQMAIEFIKEETIGTFLESAPIIPTSIKDHRGIAQLRTSIRDILHKAPQPRDIGKARLSVDRAFSIKGIGTVVTGTLTDGIFQKDDSVQIVPGRLPSRIRTIQTYNDEVHASLPGTRTALNLTHVDVGSKAHHEASAIRRGSIILSQNSGGDSTKIHAWVHRSPRLDNGQYKLVRPMKHNTAVRFHIGGGNVPARIALLEKRVLAPGESCLAQITLERPVYGLAGDRFILRDWPEQGTLAGGIILDMAPEFRKLRDRSQVALLMDRLDNHSDARAIIFSWVKRDDRISISKLGDHLPFSSAEINRAIEALIQDGHAGIKQNFLVNAEWWQSYMDLGVELVQNEHRSRPERIGLRFNSVIARMVRDGLPTELTGEWRSGMERMGFVIQGEWIHHRSHKINLPVELVPAAEKIRKALRMDPFNSSLLRDNIQSKMDQSALQFLIDSGEVIQISPDVVLHSDSFNEALKKIVAFLDSNGPSTVSELKDTIGASRKMMVPLLELLDGRGITKRDGDKRSLASAR